MAVAPQGISDSFERFVQSEKSGGILLVCATAVALALANSTVGPAYADFWQRPVAGLRIEHWINDGLMAIFFLLVGLELERELYSGELSELRNALLPVFAAIGGMVAPALIHFALNTGMPTQVGFGIPMATDIAFALAALALLGKRVPASLKVFVVAYAVMDDLGAIVIIAAFYTATLSVAYLAAAGTVWAILVVLNRRYRVMALAPYLIGGAVMWALMLKSGVHATIAGVALAFAIPYSARDEKQESPSHRLEDWLHRPVGFVILPIFALANTGIVVGADWGQSVTSANSLGIIAGLLIGKPVGVTLLCVAAVAAGLCRLPAGLGWRHVVGAGVLGGIGFTMSIFITNLAFGGDAELANASKMAILLASSAAAILGFVVLRLAGVRGPPDEG